MQDVAQYAADVSGLPAHASTHYGAGVDPLNISDLGETSIVTPANGDILRFNGTNWINITTAVFNTALDHGTLAGLSDDDHSQYHTDSRAATWHDARAVSTHSDITITGIASGELLEWDGSAWINTTALTGAYTISRASQHLDLTWTGSGTGWWLFLSSDGTHADWTNNDGMAFFHASGRRFAMTPYVAGTGQWGYEFWIDLDALVWTFDAAIRVGTNIYLHGSTTDYITRSGNYLRHANAYGHIDIGPNDSSWGHFATGNARFHFNKEICIGAHILSGYSTDLQIKRLYTDGTAHLILQSASVQFNQSLIPGTDSTYDIGSSSVAVREIFADAYDTAGNAVATFSQNDDEVFRFQINGKMRINHTVRHNQLDKGAASGAFTVDFSAGSLQYVNLTNSTSSTVSFSNVETGDIVVLKIRRGSNSGGLTWPAAVDWGDNGAPTIPTTAGQAIAVIFISHNGSTEVQGMMMDAGAKWTLADV